MTILVGVLNKNGVAVSADSAQSKRDRVVNKGGQKIFHLKGHRVAALTAGVSSIYNVEHDFLLVKFGKSMNHELDSLEDYAKAYVAFLNSERDLCTQQMRHQALYDLITFDPEWSLSIDMLDENDDDDWFYTYNKDVCEHLKKIEKDGVHQSVADYSFEDFMQYAGVVLEHKYDNMCCDESSSMAYPSQYREARSKLLYYELCGGGAFNGCTTIVFAGYGKNASEPELCELSMDGGLSGRIRYEVKTYRMDGERKSLVKTFAMDAHAKALITDQEWESSVGATVTAFSVRQLGELAYRLADWQKYKMRLLGEKDYVGGKIDLALVTDSGFRWVKCKNSNKCI